MKNYKNILFILMQKTRILVKIRKKLGTNMKFFLKIEKCRKQRNLVQKNILPSQYNQWGEKNCVVHIQSRWENKRIALIRC